MWHWNRREDSRLHLGVSVPWLVQLSLGVFVQLVPGASNLGQRAQLFFRFFFFVFAEMISSAEATGIPLSTDISVAKKTVATRHCISQKDI